MDLARAKWSGSEKVLIALERMANNFVAASIVLSKSLNDPNPSITVLFRSMPLPKSNPQNMPATQMPQMCCNMLHWMQLVMSHS